MKINSSTTPSDSLYHYTLFLLGLSATDTTSLPVNDFFRSVNSKLRKAAFLMWKSDSSWEFDDSNYDTYAIATTALVDGQQTYTLPTELLDIQRVEVMDNDGNYHLIDQFVKEKIGIALTEYNEEDGMPMYYDIMDGALFLYPAPSDSEVTTAAGLKIYLSRDIDEFDTTDTTKEPGIKEIFHPYLAFSAAYDYAISKNMGQQRVQLLSNELTKYERSIEEYYSKRNKDYKVKLSPSSRSSI